MDIVATQPKEAEAATALSGTAQAALYDRGGGLIYDDVLNVTWMQNANLLASNSFGLTYGANLGAHPSDTYDLSENYIYSDGRATWGGAMHWVDAMNQANYLGYNNWRLPTVAPINGTGFQYYTSYDPFGLAGARDYGYNISAPGTVYAGSTGSEMAYMYYNSLANKAYRDVSGYTQLGYGLVDDSNNPNDESLFTNIQNNLYWSGTEYAPNHIYAWYFNMDEGFQYQEGKGNSFYAWAVRDGDVAPVPEPETYAMMLAGLGLVGLMARKRQAI